MRALGFPGEILRSHPAQAGLRRGGLPRAGVPGTSPCLSGRPSCGRHWEDSVEPCNQEEGEKNMERVQTVLSRSWLSP